MSHLLDKWNATDQQKVTFNDAKVIARNAACNLLLVAREAWENIHKLPYSEPETGPVLHGANRVMQGIMEDALTAFHFMRSLVGRDYHDWLKYNYRIAAMGYPSRFHSEEEWTAKAQHLEDEKIRLGNSFELAMTPTKTIYIFGEIS